MVKSIWYVVVTSLIIIALALTEYFTVKATFDRLEETFSQIETKLEDESITDKEILSAQDLWVKSKKTLHVFIPHNEIKEIDLWISESVYYACDKDYKEAAAKIEVARELFEQIPKTFLIRVEKIF